MKDKFAPDSWIMGDITVDENGKPHTYRYAMLFAFRNIEEFRAARNVIDPLREAALPEGGSSE